MTQFTCYYSLVMENTIGLCSQCKHARRVSHPRQGNDYWRCAYAEVDDTYQRYPRLPVRECPAFAPVEKRDE